MAQTRIFIAGHRGMVGSAIVRKLEKDTSNQLVTASRRDLDLTNQRQVNEFFAQHNFDQVYLAAAKVGGIYANNTYPAEFIYQNLMFEANVINAAHENNIKKLLFLGALNRPAFSRHLIDLQLSFLRRLNEPTIYRRI